MRSAYVKTFLDVIKEFNREEVKYCVLRNHEFLFDDDQPLETHLDMVIDQDDMKKAGLILQKFKAIKYPPQFSKVHQGQGIFLSKEKIKVGFDIQNGGIHWNDLVYLTAEQVMKGRKKEGDIYLPGDEDALIMYICHSILGKRRFKEKYKKILNDLTKKDLDWDYIQKNMQRIFNQKIAAQLINWVNQGNFKAIEKRVYLYVTYFILKKSKNWPIFTALSFRWFFSARYCPLRKVPLLKYLVPGRPIISFIGPDGSGKSTMAEKIVNLLKKDRRAELVYSGRGNANIIPIRKIGDIYKKKEKEAKLRDEQLKIGKKKKRGFGKKIIYTLTSPIYTLDLMIRYLLMILPKRKNETVVVTDRYCSDLFLMKHVPLSLKKFLLLLFPKPTYTFYLYNDPDILYARRYSQSPAELARQMQLFEHLKNYFKAIPIKTENQEKDFDRVAEITLRELIRKGY